MLLLHNSLSWRWSGPKKKVCILRPQVKTRTYHHSAIQFDQRRLHRSSKVLAKFCCSAVKKHVTLGVAPGSSQSHPVSVWEETGPGTIKFLLMAMPWTAKTRSRMKSITREVRAWAQDDQAGVAHIFSNKLWKTSIGGIARSCRHLRAKHPWCYSVLLLLLLRTTKKHASKYNLRYFIYCTETTLFETSRWPERKRKSLKNL